MSKFYDKRTLNHEQAVAWVKQQVLEMRFAFNETHTEAGIDAFVELADPQTGSAAASFFGVQVKTQQNFAAESAEQFSFYPDAEDLRYWLSSTIPVMLIVCRARSSEAYAVFLHQYFTSAGNQTKKVVVFNKARDRFQASDEWQRRLLGIAVPRSKGLSFPPNPKAEMLSSNLLRVSLPSDLYSAGTPHKYSREVREVLREAGSFANEFIIRDKRIWSVWSLHDQAWAAAIDKDTIEQTKFSTLAFHSDLAKRAYARELLFLCLKERLWRDDIRWFKEEEMFIYYPDLERVRPVRKSVRSRSKRRESKVGLLHVTERRGRIVRCRHAAMMVNFVDVGDNYFLQVDPTWCFTRDGYRKHPRSEELIRTLRIMQKEREYHSTLRLWREVLTQERDLVRGDYPFISFSDYLEFDCPVSVPDELWRASSDPEAQIDLEQSLLKFDE